MESTAKPPDPMPCALAAILLPESRVHDYHMQKTMFLGPACTPGQITMCTRTVPACRVRSYGEGGRRESERRPECRETVPDTAGVLRQLFVVHETGRIWGVCRRVAAWRTELRHE